MAVLVLIAIADGVLIGSRSISRKPKKITVLSIILGIIYGLIAALTIVSSVSLLLGAIVVFGPVALWLLRILFFGTRDAQYNK